jgi:hypothetical protein
MALQAKPLEHEKWLTSPSGLVTATMVNGYFSAKQNSGICDTVETVVQRALSSDGFGG